MNNGERGIVRAVLDGQSMHMRHASKEMIAGSGEAMGGAGGPSLLTPWGLRNPMHRGSLA